MSWHLELSQFLLQIAVGGSALLLVAWLILRSNRPQPALRVRLIECTLLACLFLPILSQLPFLPRVFTGMIVSSEQASNASASIDASETGSTPLVRPWETMRSLPADSPDENEPLPKLAVMTLISSPDTTPSLQWTWNTTSVVFLSLWLLVCLYLAYRWIRGLYRLRKLMRSAIEVSPRIYRVFEEMSGRPERTVLIVMSHQIEHPLTFGWLRPVIVLPLSACASSNESELRFGLAHEWSHVEKRDIRRWHLASLVRFLFFWQPLFWKLREQLRLAQDLLADAFAARQSTEPEEYADYLVRIARRAHGLPTEVALGIAEKPSQLYRRVTMLIQESPVPRNLSRLRSVAVFSLSFLLLGVVSTVRLDAEDRTQKETPTQEKAKEKTEAKKTETPAKAESYTYTGLVRTVGTLKPIEGATVTVRRSTTGSVSRGEKEELIQETKHKTDKDGKYTFTIPPEQSSLYTLYIELDVSAPNHATKSGFGYSFTMIRQNEKTGERPFFEDVRLRPAKEITGLVETPEGKPAKSVRVLCFSTSSGGPFNAEGEYEFGSFDETFTDANGKFTLNAITPGEFVYWVLPKDYAPSTHALKKDQRGDIGKVILQEGIRMKGKAVDTEGKPIPNIYIAAENANGNELLNNLAVADSIRRVTKTNEKGEFEFLPLPPSKYRIQPSERDYEPSESHKGRSPKLPLEHVFLPQKVTIKEGEKPDPIEVRAHPFVLLEAQFLNAQGKPSGGHAPHFTGRIDGEFWSSEMKPEKGGKMTLKVPHGLENAQLSFIDNEHNSVRFRKSKDDTLNHGYSLDLGTMDRDVKTIEVIRYIAPTLVLNIKTKDGTKLNAKEVGITGWYMKHEKMRGIGFTSKGRPTEMNFQRQDDGKFRTSQMLPDEEMTVTVFHDEYKDSVFKVSLKEGETKEMEVELEKK